MLILLAVFILCRIEFSSAVTTYNINFVQGSSEVGWGQTITPSFTINNEKLK
jgi:hypothetical protein